MLKTGQYHLNMQYYMFRCALLIYSNCSLKGSRKAGGKFVEKNLIWVYGTLAVYYIFRSHPPPTHGNHVEQLWFLPSCKATYLSQEQHVALLVLKKPNY